MFLTSVIVLVLCSIAGKARCDYVVEPVSVSVNQSCSPDETDCGLGCCPYPNAECCIDGYECCQQGQTCIPFIGVCVGAVNNNGDVSLTSSKSARVRSSTSKCPPDTTECGPDRCCPLRDAVCCKDGKHCCPSGFKCDETQEKCVPDSTQINELFYSTNGFDKPLTKVTKKSPYKTCPGTNRFCPSYMSCCVLDNGGWGCCPNPSLRHIRYGGGQCCDTIFGYMCCPDDYPTCTIFGCTK